jgi:rare lipoprotein A
MRACAVVLATVIVLPAFLWQTARAESRPGQSGIASIYDYRGKTASGERSDPGSLSAAHRSLPFGTRIRVTNSRNGRSVVVRINDRGPFIRGRVVDVTPAAARVLGFSGLASVTLEVVAP